MDFINILQAGVASGTVLLFATLGEVLAERSGVLNLGVEGMMLIGAMSAYSVAVKLNSPWLGVLRGHAVCGGNQPDPRLYLDRAASRSGCEWLGSDLRGYRSQPRSG